MNCKLCGKPVEVERYDVDRIVEIMETEHVCFHCAFWYEQHELDQNDPKRQGCVAVIDGHHYVLGDGRGFFKGYAGGELRIRFNDGREVVCDDLWHQGEIPAHLIHLFPDNAEFVR